MWEIYVSNPIDRALYVVSLRSRLWLFRVLESLVKLLFHYTFSRPSFSAHAHFYFLSIKAQWSNQLSNNGVWWWQTALRLILILCVSSNLFNSSRWPRCSSPQHLHNVCRIHIRRRFEDKIRYFISQASD